MPIYGKNDISFPYRTSNMPIDSQIRKLRYKPVAAGIVMAAASSYQLFMSTGGLFFWFLLLCGIGMVIEEVIRANKNMLVTKFSI